ncbi:receptor like protein 22-like [Salvia hispanica]|uniref:receptor like protein 22-like n=1 Tax=Salvia hispanica TaxID=49212 RepID=UPI0020096BA1|nr:receptor like protein 22-like [Salvia hispanica]
MRKISNNIDLDIVHNPGEHDQISLLPFDVNLNGELPSSICMSAIRILLLSNNTLEGRLSHCIGSLTVFHLNKNQFSGLIPSTFFKDCNLMSINLGDHKFYGRLPKSLTNCQSLKGLDIGNNRIKDEFPFWMESLRELRVLVLRSNKFGGNMSLPSRTKFPFPRLQVLDVSHNEFMGSLPQSYFNNFRAMIEPVEIEYDEFQSDLEMRLILKGQDRLIDRLLDTFTTLDLSSNIFTGTIPPSIGNLKILIYLNLSHNTLTGHIPSSLRNMSELESLDLSTNKLDGEIPNELTRLTFLAKLNLSTNNLVGQIPQSNQFSTFENDSYM